jgi:CBS domain-containing protein
MLVVDAMKRDIASVGPEQNLHEAARLMRKLDIGFLPVVDEHRRPIGALTDRDIVVRACAEDFRPSEVSVRQAMTLEVVTCRPLDDLRQAEELMRLRQKSRLMVVGDDRQLVGVLSLSDIAEEESEPVEVAQTIRDIAAREYH